MGTYTLRYTQSGLIFIDPKDDCRLVVDAMLANGYDEDYCVALDFTPPFLAKLMEAGFLVMSMGFYDQAAGQTDGPPDQVILLPKLHLVRSVLFWGDIRETKSARRLLGRYELRFDTEFDRVLERCAEVHGEDWLTAPLREGIRGVRGLKGIPVKPVSFELYRNGDLKAGEFGVAAGGVYTSYSGYREEDSAGTAQMLLTGRYLQEAGYAFWDLGMPLDYKDRLGARNIDPAQFVRLFRQNAGPGR
jgi:Leu/Phe-tRNA-protein transferase